MQKALELLREGSMPVRDVATSVGYRQAAQFAKTFRRHHGRPPSSIRRERSTTAGSPGEGTSHPLTTLEQPAAAA